MNRVLIIDLKQHTYNVENISSYENIEIGESDLIFKAPLLSGYGIVGINRLTVMTKNIESKVGGHFAHYLKCNGYDYIIIKNDSQFPVNICIDKNKIIFEEVKLIHKDTEQMIEKMYLKNQIVKNKEFEFAYLGIAGINKVDFAKIMFGNNKSCGKNGLGKLMGEKQLLSIRLTKHENLIPFDKAILQELNNRLKKNIDNADTVDWYNENSSCYGCIINCKSTALKKIIKNDFTYDEAFQINEICDSYGIDSIIFSELYSYYRNKNISNLDIVEFANKIVSRELTTCKISESNTNNNQTKENNNKWEELGFCKFLINKNILQNVDVEELSYSVQGKYY